MLDSSLAAAAGTFPVPPGSGSADIAETVLEQARERARAEGLPYAGGVSPADAWTLVSDGRAVLVDVRTAEERKFVGQVPAGLHVAWATGTKIQSVSKVDCARMETPASASGAVRPASTPISEWSSGPSMLNAANGPTAVTVPGRASYAQTIDRSSSVRVTLQNGVS